VVYLAVGVVSASDLAVKVEAAVRAADRVEAVRAAD
jgi:hypothetical protein